MAKDKAEGPKQHLDQTAQQTLKQHVLAIEKLEEEKKETATNIKERFAAAKAQGFDPKVMRKVIRDRKRKKEEVETEESITVLYRAAMGDVPEFEREERGR